MEKKPAPKRKKSPVKREVKAEKKPKREPKKEEVKVWNGSTRLEKKVLRLKKNVDDS